MFQNHCKKFSYESPLRCRICLFFSTVLESWLDHSGELEPPDPLSRLPQLKQRIRRLLCDLCTVRRLSVWRWNVSLLNHWTLTVDRDGLEHKVCSQDCAPSAGPKLHCNMRCELFFFLDWLTDWRGSFHFTTEPEHFCCLQDATCVQPRDGRFDVMLYELLLSKRLICNWKAQLVSSSDKDDSFVLLFYSSHVRW